eukprot:CCRYP_007568-RA/>CCRYP_007568-RA protein AED:0.47 eAED:0.47 QI:0/0/0/1/1/1/2/0/63
MDSGPPAEVEEEEDAAKEGEADAMDVSTEATITAEDTESQYRGAVTESSIPFMKRLNHIAIKN